MRNVLGLLLLVPLAVGCGAKESALSGSDRAMKDAGSSRVELTMTGRGGPKFSGTGSIDYSNDRGEFVLTGGDVPGGEMRWRFIGRTTYFGLILAGKLRWQKQLVDDATTGTDRFTPGPGGPNPDQLLGTLIKASKRVETVGNEKIRGVSTTHYRAHLEEKELGEEVVVEVWIDGEGLVRRLSVLDPLGSTIFDFFDFGVEVDIEAPPADETISEERFMTLLERECAARKISENDVCAMFAGSGSGSGSYESEAETVPMPEEAE
jgi:hypothetical protein